MGCASSKPSSSSTSKGKKHKDANKQQQQQSGNAAKSQQQQQVANGDAQKHGGAEFNADDRIEISDDLRYQIDGHNRDIIDFIVRQVRKDLNAELISHSAKTPVALKVSGGGGGGGAANFASVAAAAAHAQDNDDLITDVATKAVHILLKSSGTGASGVTYKQLGDTLRTSQYMCKSQAHKTRICDLTVNTIRQCVQALKEQQARDGAVNISELLMGSDVQESQQQLAAESTVSSKLVGSPSVTTPPSTPQSKQMSPGAVLLTRMQANEVARILFLSNRARPVIHLSPSTRDSYYVSKQIGDGTNGHDDEQVVSKEEIDEILNNVSNSINLAFTPPMSGGSLEFAQNDNAKHRTTNKMTTTIVETPLAAVPVNNAAASEASSPSSPSVTVTAADTAKRNLNSDFDNEELTHVETITKTTTTTTHTNTTIIGDEPPVTVVTQTTKTDWSSTPPPSSELQTAIGAAVMLATLANQKNEDNEQQLQQQSADDWNWQNLTAGAADVGNTTYEDAADTSVNAAHDESHSSSSHNTAEVENNEQEKGALDPTLKQSLLDDRFYNNDSFKNGPPVNASVDVNNAAVIIQASVKGHQTREDQDAASHSEQNSEVAPEQIRSITLSCAIPEAIVKAATESKESIESSQIASVIVDAATVHVPSVDVKVAAQVPTEKPSAVLIDAATSKSSVEVEPWKPKIVTTNVALPNLASVIVDAATVHVPSVDVKVVEQTSTEKPNIITTNVVLTPNHYENDTVNPSNLTSIIKEAIENFPKSADVTNVLSAPAVINIDSNTPIVKTTTTITTTTVTTTTTNVNTCEEKPVQCQSQASDLGLSMTKPGAALLADDEAASRERAAITIQSNFRGFRARKQLNLTKKSATAVIMTTAAADQSASVFATPLASVIVDAATTPSSDDVAAAALAQPHVILTVPQQMNDVSTPIDQHRAALMSSHLGSIIREATLEYQLSTQGGQHQ